MRSNDRGNSNGSGTPASTPLQPDGAAGRPDAASVSPVAAPVGRPMGQTAPGDPPTHDSGDDIGISAVTDSPGGTGVRQGATGRLRGLLKGDAAVKAARQSRQAREVATAEEREARVQEVVAETLASLPTNMRDSALVRRAVVNLAEADALAADLRARYYSGKLKAARELTELTRLHAAMQSALTDLISKWPTPGERREVAIPPSVNAWLDSLDDDLQPKPPATMSPMKGESTHE
jgi:hypothetical protein